MDAGRAAGQSARDQVVFIAGTSWSGSTLLEQTLAQIDDCVSLGELFWIWDPHWPDMVCECGHEFRSCEFWQTVLIEAYGNERDRIRAQVRARSEGLWRHSIVSTLARSHSRLHPGAALAELGAMVAPIYHAAARVSGASVTIDASKAGLWGLAISKAESIDLRVVHLVRDPMGYVASDGRQRAVPYPLGAVRPPRPAGRSLITWLLLHFEAELLARRVPASTVVLYEDFVRSPFDVAARVATAIGLDPRVDDELRQNALIVDQLGHAIGGNPRRPKPGRTTITRSELATPESTTPSLLRHTLVPVARGRYEHYAAESKLAEIR